MTGDELTLQKDDIKMNCLRLALAAAEESDMLIGKNTSDLVADGVVEVARKFYAWMTE